MLPCNTIKVSKIAEMLFFSAKDARARPIQSKYGTSQTQQVTARCILTAGEGVAPGQG